MTASIVFHISDDTRVWVHDYGTEHTPILALHAVGVGLSLTPAPSTPAAQQLAFARELLAGATAYLSALEHHTRTAAVDTSITKAA